MRIQQQGRWFWGGPAHGDYRALDRHYCDVAVFDKEPVPWEAVVSLSTPIPYHVETYFAQEFMWKWKGERRTGLIMTIPPSGDSYPAVFIEIESIMDFLGNLWG